MSDIIKMLASLRLLAGLLILIGLMAMAGTFVPQGDEAPKIVQTWGPRAYDILSRLDITNTYQSWWFLAALFLFTLNLAACTWVRLPKVWKISRGGEELYTGEYVVPRSQLESQWTSPLAPDEALRRSAPLLKAFVAKPHRVEVAQGLALMCEKNQISLWGSYIVHLGLFMLLAAGALKIMFGYHKVFTVLEGEKTFVPRELTGFGLWVDYVPVAGLFDLPYPRMMKRLPAPSTVELELDRFVLEYYPNTAMPKLFRSDLKVFEKDKPERQAEIEVNKPLHVSDVMLYQASWGYEGLRAVSFDAKLPGEKEIFDVVAPYRRRFKLLDSGWEAEVTDFYPTAEMAGPGKLVLTSSQLDNPAIRVKFWQQGKERAHFWHVFQYPEIQMSKVKGLEVVGKSVDPIPFTVLQVNYDPGINLALTGSLVIVLGLFASFYMFYRRFWLLASPGPGGTSVIRLAGWCRRNKLSFKRDFDKLTQRLRTELGDTSDSGKAS